MLIIISLGPDVMVTITPSQISGNAGQVPINFTCTAAVVESIMSTFRFPTWLHNGEVVTPDERISVCNCIFVM